jgi:hypothetical protein
LGILGQIHGLLWLFVWMNGKVSKRREKKKKRDKGAAQTKGELGHSLHRFAVDSLADGILIPQPTHSFRFFLLIQRTNSNGNVNVVHSFSCSFVRSNEEKKNNNTDTRRVRVWRELMCGGKKKKKSQKGFFF